MHIKRLQVGMRIFASMGNHSLKYVINFSMTGSEAVSFLPNMKMKRTNWVAEVYETKKTVLGSSVNSILIHVA
jgi:hypothetical protein